MAKKVVFSGQIFSIIWDEIPQVDGKQIVYETVDAPDVVRVYPIDRDSIWLIREFRNELGREILRTVSGRIESGESPTDAARRELREELGIISDRAEIFATSRPILKVNSVVHHILAMPTRLQASALEPGERIRPAVIPLVEIENLVWSGEIIEDVIALQLLRLARDPNQFSSPD